MKARASLSIVIVGLVLGAFSACQETSKHKSQSTGSSQVSASSGVSGQDSLSDNRKSSTNKTTQSNQAQLQQLHSDFSTSASKVNSAISMPSNPDTDLSSKPKAITKKQAKDFCHSDWVKQHYPCKKGETCHYSQEQVYDDADPYQCKVLSSDLAIMLILKEKNTGESDYYPAIDLINMGRLMVIDHFEDKSNIIGEPSFSNTYLQVPMDPTSKKYSLFNLISWYTSNRGDTSVWKNQSMDMYQYNDDHIKRVITGLGLSYYSQSQDYKMEKRLPRIARNRCINEIEDRKTIYRFGHHKTRNMPSIYLSEVGKYKWIRGYSDTHPLTASTADNYLCDEKKPSKTIKRKNIIRRKRIIFDGKKYPLPKYWGLEYGPIDK